MSDELKKGFRSSSIASCEPRSSSQVGRAAVVVMAKAPRPGAVKTRLIGVLGAERAAELYRCFLEDTLETLRAVSAERPSATSVLCFTPRDSGREFGRVGARLLEQRGDGLGERLRHCFEDLFEAGYGRVVAVGADSPTLPASHVVRALDLLAGGADLVLGPSADGGYYLIGMRELAPELFEGIAWSTPGVLAETLAAARAAGRSAALLPEWYDVDTAEELALLRCELARRGEAARHTRAFLATMADQEKSP